MSLKSYNNLSNIQNSKNNEQAESDSENEQETGNTSQHFSITEINSIITTHIEESKKNQTKCNWKQISKKINYQLTEAQLNNKAKYLRSKLKNLK